jgi:hypothetical protein
MSSNDNNDSLVDKDDGNQVKQVTGQRVKFTVEKAQVNNNNEPTSK